MLRAVKYSVLILLIIPYFCFAEKLSSRGLVGVYQNGEMREYNFTLQQDSVVNLNLAIVDHDGGELEAKLIVAQGIKKIAVLDAGKDKVVDLKKGTYQVVVYGRLVSADYAYLRVGINLGSTNIHDLFQLINRELIDEKFSPAIAQEFTLSEAQPATVILNDYAELVGESSLVKPLKNVFYSIQNVNTSELVSSGNQLGFNGNLAAGKYLLNIWFIADQDVLQSNDSLVSGLGWEIASKDTNFSDLQLVQSDALTTPDTEIIYDLGYIDFIDGRSYDLSLEVLMGLSFEGIQVLFVKDATGFFVLDSDQPIVAETQLAGKYRAYAYVPQDQAGLLNVSISESGNKEPYWSSLIPIGGVQKLGDLSSPTETAISVEMRDLLLAARMQSAEFLLSNGPTSYEFTLSERPIELVGAIKPGKYSLFAVTRSEGNALLYLELKDSFGKTLFKDYIYQGEGFSYIQDLSVKDGVYSMNAVDHDFPAMASSFSAAILQDDQLLYKFQSFGTQNLLESGDLNLSHGDYSIAFTINTGEADAALIAYELKDNEFAIQSDPQSGRSLGGSRESSSGGSLGVFCLLLPMLIAFKQRRFGFNFLH